MGNAESMMAHRKLSDELPEKNYNWKYRGRLFYDEYEREQFIYGVLAVVTNNGTINTDGQDFKLLYSRRADNPERIVARIVAIKDGVIKSKIEPEVDGADQKEAFLALKKDVEIKLDRLLQTVPSGPSGDGSTGGRSTATTVDTPPAYSTPVVGIPDRKKG